METPLILILIKYLLKFIAYLCSLLSLPITLYSIVLNKILRADTKSSLVHFLIFIPRCIIVIPFFPSFPLLAYLYGYLVSLGVGGAKYMPYAIGVAFLAGIVIGYWFTRSMSMFKDSIDKLAMVGKEGYFKGLGECVLDIGAMFSFLISVASVIRIPFMLIAAANNSSFPTESKRKLRTQFYRHLLLIPIDIIGLIFFLLTLVTVLRVKSLFSFIRKEQLGTPWRLCFNFTLRFVMVKQFCIAVLELFVLFFSFLFVLCPWRIKGCREEMKKANTQARAFTEMFLKELSCVADLIAIVCYAVTVVATVYRIYYSVGKIKSKDTLKRMRKETFKQSLMVLADILATVLMVIMLTNPYRIYKTIKRIARERDDSYVIKVFIEFGKYIRDLPFVFMGLFTCIAVWRAPVMLYQIFRKCRRSREKRSAVLHHFVYVFIDIIDVPFILASLIILITLWRAYHFVVGFMYMKNRNEQRKYVLKQIVAWFLDIPTFVALALVTITIYRLPATYRLLREYFKNKRFEGQPLEPTNASQVAPPPLARDGDDEDNPAPQTSALGQASSWRSIVLKQFVLVLIDIPFPILLLLTLWRLPILIGRLKEITDPSRKYAQRRLLILRYLLLVFLDILCLPIILFVLISFWRMPSFVKLVKEYKRGDNEHSMIAKLFLRTLVDIPFVILGLITMVFPWRGIFLIKSVYSATSDLEARSLAARYFAIMFVDILIFLELTWVFCTMWRIKTFFSTHKESIKPVAERRKWDDTFTLLKAATVTFITTLVDILTTTQILIIAIFVKQLVPFIRAVKKERLDRGENFELANILPWTGYYFTETLADIPHYFLMPLKLLGLAFFPIHMYLDKRGAKFEKVYSSFLSYALHWLNEICKKKMNFYGLDLFLTINVLSSFLIVPNELAMIPVAVNCIYMFLVTLGSPLWKASREKYGWDALGKAQGPFFIVEYVTVILQSLFFPLFLFIQGLMICAPVIISLGLYQSPRPSFAHYWELLFDSRNFWANAKHFNSGIWVLQAFWFLVCVVSWQVTFKVAKKHFPIFSPWKAYYWLVKKVFAGKIWWFYTQILAVGTKICFRLRRACFLGELLMFPLFSIWAFWPIIIPIITKIYYIFIASGLISVALTYFAYKIIKQNWTEKVSTQSDVPALSLTGVFVDLPESGGIVFTFVGTKRPGFTIRDARLSIEGEKIWKAIEAVIGKGKIRAALLVVGYPISLCPMFMDIADVNGPGHEVILKLQIGIAGSKPMLKKKTIVKMLEKIQKQDDATFDFVIEYGKKDFGWNKMGVLCKFTTTVTGILETGQSSGDDIGAPRQIFQQSPDLNVPAPPPPMPAHYKKNPATTKATSPPPPLTVPPPHRQLRNSFEEIQSRNLSRVNPNFNPMDYEDFYDGNYDFLNVDDNVYHGNDSEEIQNIQDIANNSNNSNDDNNDNVDIEKQVDKSDSDSHSEKEEKGDEENQDDQDDEIQVDDQDDISRNNSLNIV
ncbi:hypothetical protein CYY_002042 [Polysphondylium violaceum]|uniref:Uncharacterized protein n=1 Tax=Polysphondylium violaceum TaxID=133409 RepID=A0A8J4Q0W0_9MYCE|nr:hypothetical protein CYY_002042 [Polysphondylium violaceum]